MRLLLDEMYAGKLAQELRDQGIDAVTAAELGMAGRPDGDIFAAAVTAVAGDRLEDRLVYLEHQASG